MSRRGDCWDNAVAESFFATLKGELVDHEAYATRAAATASIGDYINVFYNTQRRHSTIGYLSPIEFEIEVAIGEADSIVRLFTKSGEAHTAPRAGDPRSASSIGATCQEPRRGQCFPPSWSAS
jgi:hypothetical protein